MTFFRKINSFQIVSYIITASLFFFTYLQNGVLIFPDSPGYIENSIYRNCGYPLLLDLFEFVFGESYLQCVIIFQILILTYAICSICFFLKQQFELSNVWTSCILAGVIIIFMASSLFSATGLFTYLSILTEGVTYPLALMITKLLLQGLFSKSLRPLYLSLLPITLSTLIRTQTIFFVIVFICAYSYIFIVAHYPKKNLLILAGILFAMFFTFSYANPCYNLIYNDYFVGTPFGQMSFAGKVLYLSDSTDELALDEVTNTIFRETMLEGELQNLTHQTSTNLSFSEKYLHYETSYDPLCLIVYNDAVQKNSNLSSPHLELYKDEVSQTLIHTLLPKHWDRYIELTFAAGLFGLLRSNSCSIPSHPMISMILICYSICLYLLSIGLTLYTFKKDKYSKSGIFMCLSYLILLGNIAPSVLVHFPISRYAFLAMPMFYLSLFSLIYTEIIKPIVSRFRKEQI